MYNCGPANQEQMNMFNSMKQLLPIALALATTACTHRITDFTFLSTKNVDLSQAAAFERGEMRATGEDQVAIIIIFPTGIPNIKEATDRAIESVPGAVGLVDGVIYRTNFYIPMLFGIDKFVVEGTPLINRKAIKNAAIDAGHYVSEFDQKTNAFVTKAVSAAEYAEIRGKYLSKGQMTKVDTLSIEG